MKGLLRNTELPVIWKEVVVSQDCQSSDRDIKAEPSEYETGTLTAPPRGDGRLEIERLQGPVPSLSLVR
jgi:hypothetical protein